MERVRMTSEGETKVFIPHDPVNQVHNQVHDPVNHPEHYTEHPSGIECIEVVQYMDFIIGNIIKYCWRCGLKKGVSKLEDLEKARWYIDRAILNEKNKLSL